MTTFKSYRIWMSVGIFSLVLLPQIGPAVPITGTISFNGSVTGFENTAGNGTVAPDYSLAHSLMFGPSFVSAGAVGAFSGVPVNSEVKMFSPLLINPPGLPMPSSTPLLTTTMGGFKFVLTALTEDTLLSPFTTLTLRGTGTISDGNSQDDNSGTWTATFNETNSSWSAILQAGTPLPVMDNGSCGVLLGLGLISLRTFGKFRKDNCVR